MGHSVYICAWVRVGPSWIPPIPISSTRSVGKALVLVHTKRKESSGHLKFSLGEGDSGVLLRQIVGKMRMYSLWLLGR